MALFRADYSGRGELSERQQKVCNLAVDSYMCSTHVNIFSLPKYVLTRIPFRCVS